MTLRRFGEWAAASAVVIVGWVFFHIWHLSGVGVFLVVVAGWFLLRGYRFVPAHDLDAEFAELLGKV